MAYCNKSIAFIALLLGSTAATAQVQPEIAYAKAGGRPEVHLINADGTGHSLLYVAPRGTEIYHVDFDPTGGELAIEEHAIPRGRSTLASTIKIINFDANGVMVGSVRTHALSCLTGSLDYHPTDGTLLYRDCSSPKRIARLDTETMVATDLGLSHDAFIASWLDATNLLYWANGTFWTVSTAALTSPTNVLSFPFPGALDTSASATKGLWSDGRQIRLVDVTAGTISSFQYPGQRGHFSPNDEHVVYVTGNEVGQKNQYVLIRRTDGAGAPTNLTGKGSFTALDWGN